MADACAWRSISRVNGTIPLFNAVEILHMEKETQTEDRCRKNFIVMSKGTKGNKKMWLFSSRKRMKD